MPNHQTIVDVERRTSRFSTLVRRAVVGFAIVCVAAVAVVQRPSAAPEATGVIKLMVKFKAADALKAVGRKRFFLIKGTLQDNNSVIESMKQGPLTSRECYYRRIGASDKLIAWLKDGDCESVFCRKVETEFTEGEHAVPEFEKAVAVGTGKKEFFFDRNVARDWLVVNLPEKIRSGFYDEQQANIKTIVSLAEAASRASSLSVMTDSRGVAYFTDVPVPPDKDKKFVYVISNIVPAEIAGHSVIWNCQIELTSEDAGGEKQYLIPNTRSEER